MDDTARDESRASVRTVRIGTALSEVMLMLVEGGRRYFREHPDEGASEPDELDVIAAGCQYLREHPEALRAPFPFTPRSESR